MDQSGNSGLETQLAAALDWWRDAGVDAIFHDEPANWIVPAEEKKASGESPRSRAGRDLGQADGSSANAQDPRLRGEAAVLAGPVELEPAFTQLPQTLDEFTAWWLAEPALDGGRTTGRVPPRGAAGARLMVLVAEPEREDGETLLSGPQGALLDAMLSALGISRQDSYVASILPRHTPHPDWDSLAGQGIGRVAAHHIALVRPRELLSFGQNIPSLLGNDPTNTSANSPAFNHEGLSVPWLSDRGLGSMLERPRWKAGFWRRWLDRAGVI